jgi:hypothetical protein
MTASGNPVLGRTRHQLDTKRQACLCQPETDGQHRSLLQLGPPLTGTDLTLDSGHAIRD